MSTPRQVLSQRTEALEMAARLQRRTLGVHCARLREHRGLGLIDSVLRAAKTSRGAMLTTGLTLLTAVRRKSIWGFAFAAAQWWWRRNDRIAQSRYERRPARARFFQGEPKAPKR